MNYPAYDSTESGEIPRPASLPAPGALGSPEAANHIDATRDLAPHGRPVETEVIEDVYDE